MRKTYVLDTNVLIHDPFAPNKFRGNNVIIPIFVVMELDGLKRAASRETAASARTASRTLEAWIEKGDIHVGVMDSELDVHLKIVSSHAEIPGLDSLRESDSGRKMDLLIFAVAKSIPDSILVTKDLNLRIIAASESQAVEDYKTDRVAHIDQFRGFRYAEDVDVLTESFALNYQQMPSSRIAEDLIENEAVIFSVPSSSGEDQEIPYRNIRGVCHPCRRDTDTKKLAIQPRNVEQKIAFDLLLDTSVELVTLIGQAGCGKTLCALAAAVAQLAISPRAKNVHYTKLILAKPTVEMGPGIGYLPGDMKEKMDPWLMSFYDNLDIIFPETTAAKEKGATKDFRSWDYLIEQKIIEIQPLYSIRGRSISNAIILLDEAQNTNAHEIKSFVTRLGEGSKIILCGDPYQIDRPFLDQHSNGLVYVADRMRNLENTGTVFFTKTERSRLADQAAKLL